MSAVLSALSAFLVMHQTQAKNASPVSWISPTAFSPKPHVEKMVSAKLGL
jgi:hypothetical protein